MKEKPEVTVLIATYNANEKDIIRSLNSVLYQKDVILQVVITDDGSKVFPKERILKAFEKQHFSNFTMIENPDNRGTVANFLSGAMCCDSEYIKVLGQGDLLIDEFVLRDLVEYAQKKDSDLIASKAVYFRCINDKYEVICADAMPQFVSMYSSKVWQKRCSVLYEDDAHGATLFYRKNVFVHYLREFEGKIKFIEDKIQKLMILDNCRVDFLDRDTVFYESTVGISNNPSRVTALLNDKTELNEIIIGHIKNRSFKKEFYEFQTIKERLSLKYTRFDSIRWTFSVRGFLFYRIRKQWFPKKTSKNVNKHYLDLCWDID